MMEKHFLHALRRIVFGLLVAACAALPAWAAGAAQSEATIGEMKQLFGDFFEIPDNKADIVELEQQLAEQERTLGKVHLEVAHTLNELAVLYADQSRYAAAESCHKRALDIRKKLLGEEHSDVAISLNNLASVYDQQSRYADAEPLYKHACKIWKKTLGASHPNVATCMSNLAALYWSLGQYTEAEQLFKSSLEIREMELGKKHPAVAQSLGNLGVLLSGNERYADAEPLIKRELEIYENELGPFHPLTANSLHNLAILYARWSQYDKAVPFLERALAINKIALNPKHPNLAQEFSSLATAYHKQARHAEAQPLFKQALSTAAASNQADAMRWVLHELHESYAESTPDLSIFYGKQTVNVIQSVRAMNTGLDKASQQSFLKSNQGYYNKLADQLFAQNRLAEGQQVLAMLKEAEYHEFTGKSADAADDPRRSHVEYSPREAKWERRFQDIAAKLAKAEPESAEYAAAKKEMDAFFEDVKKAFAEGAPGEANRLDNISPMQQPLAQLGEGTALVQYLMPQERLWILITTQDGMRAQQVNISADALAQKINAFKNAIITKSPDVNTLGKELHGLLIAPVAEDLKGAKTLMLAPDGALRYLPFAALHDGEQYLTQRYVLSNYTSVTDEKGRITERPQAQWHFAGFGVSKKVGDLKLEALPTVEKELQGIQGNAMQGTIWLNEAFTRDALQEALRKPPPVVHVASHFVFAERGNEQASWLLLGDGGKLTLADIRRSYRFDNVDLVALSACNTGMGGKDQDGREVEGLGVLVQRQGAKGVLASLWEVADESTGQFMQLFYSLRQRQGLSKAEALQKAQLDFIDRPAKGSKVCDESGNCHNPHSHPYYWAPFILMGNWL